jgi:hypothetical protein
VSKREAPFKILSKEEREIVIVQTDADTAMSVYISSPAWFNYLKRQGHKPVKIDKYGAWFQINSITIAKSKPKRVLSKEEKEKLAERFAKARAAKIKGKLKVKK